MLPDEGVIKFECLHSPGPPPDCDLRALLGWRRLLHRLGIVGQDPARYGGAGFGNVSQRMTLGFAVSGTQTGGSEALSVDGFCRVVESDLARNQVRSIGPVLPSSEAMTHAMIYQVAPFAQVVLHVHSPELWHALEARTAPEVAYGSVEMAQAIARLIAQDERVRVLAMGGHEDGAIAFGGSAEEAGSALLGALARALHPPR